MNDWHEPFWFHDDDQWRSEREGEDLRCMSDATTARSSVEKGNMVVVSRAQFLLQYMLAIAPVAPELDRNADVRAMGMDRARSLTSG